MPTYMFMYSYTDEGIWLLTILMAHTDSYRGISNVLQDVRPKLP